MMEDDEKTDELIDGVIITVFEDFGPSVRFNESPLDESIALNLAVKGMTALSDSTEEEIFGPFPIPEAPELQALAFMTSLGTETSEDERILEFGRSTVVWLIYKAHKKRQVLHAAGLLQPYLTLLLSKLKSEKDMSDSAMKFLNDKLTSIRAAANIKVYGIDKQDKIVEFIDDSLIPASQALLIADLGKKVLYILFPVIHPSPMFKRKMIMHANNLNNDKWKNSLTIRPIDEPDEMEKILHFYKLDQVVIDR